MTEPHYTFRPRPGGVWALTASAVLGALVLVGSVVVGVLVIQTPALLTRKYPEEWVFIVAAMALLGVSGLIHAYGGATRLHGPLPNVAQLWRQRALRQLPALPPLSLWKLVLLYGLPSLLIGACALLSGDAEREAANVLFVYEEQLNTQGRRRAALNLGFIQVSCKTLPRTSALVRPLCFVLQEQEQPEVALQSWINSQRRLFKSVASAAPEGSSPLAQLDGLRGAGVIGDSQVVDLRFTNGYFNDTLRPYRLTYLALTEDAAGPVPDSLRAQAEWLRRQPFDAYFIVSPER